MLNDSLSIETNLYSKKAEAIFCYLVDSIKDTQEKVYFNNRPRFVFSRPANTARLLKIDRDLTSQIVLLFPSKVNQYLNNTDLEQVTLSQTSVASFFKITNPFAQKAAIASHFADLIQTYLIDKFSEDITYQLADESISITKDDLFIIRSFLLGRQPAYSPDKIQEVLGSNDNPLVHELETAKAETVQRATANYNNKLCHFLDDQAKREKQLFDNAKKAIIKQLKDELEEYKEQLAREYEDEISETENLSKLINLF